MAIGSPTGRAGLWTMEVDYGSLRARGLQATEAGNLTAYLHGLAPVESGWTLGEIKRLQFARWLVEHGYLDESHPDAYRAAAPSY
jgi:hypothetical protein